MHFGDNPFGLPTNTDLEKVLKQNLDHTNPLEMKSYKDGDGKKKLFPFWVPVKDPMDSATDYKQYYDSKAKALDIKKKDDKVGIVNPKSDKNYEDSSLLDKIKKMISNQNNAKTFDNSGVVKAPSNDMGSTKTATQDVVNKVDVPMTPVVDKATGDKVGKGEKGNMGAVKPKADMGTQNMPDMTKGSEKAKGDNVGAVKQPESGKLSNPTDINFDKFKTDQVKKSPFKKK